VETSAQSAEAPTEPTGETVGATCCTRRDCEKELGLNVQALFGAFRFLQTGSTYVQLRLQENEIYLAFSKSVGVCDKKDDFSLIVNSLLNITKQHL
jgi:hypothetical protein